MDPTTRVELARSLKARLDAKSAKGGASSGRDIVPIFNFSCRDVVCLYIGLFVYILFKFVKILYFDGLIFKCCFFYVNYAFECCRSCLE